ncbi:MAG: hypothetical protein NVV68_06945 [Dokdonella sp.]|nr:hypothetical protein [Dokdonella sp.]
MTTELQRAALTRARAGNWDLADAIELLARQQQARVDGERLHYALRSHRLACFIYSTAKCDCCIGVERDGCSYAEAADWWAIDMRGDRLDADDPTVSGQTFTVEQARAIVQAFEEELAACA